MTAGEDALRVRQAALGRSHGLDPVLDQPMGGVARMDHSLGITPSDPRMLARHTAGERQQRMQAYGLSPRGTGHFGERTPSDWLSQAIGMAPSGAIDDEKPLPPIDLPDNVIALIGGLNGRPHRMRPHASWKSAGGWTPRHAAFRSDDPTLPHHTPTILAAIPAELKPHLERVQRTLLRNRTGKPDPLDGQAKPKGPLALELKPRPPKGTPRGAAGTLGYSTYSSNGAEVGAMRPTSSGRPMRAASGS